MTDAVAPNDPAYPHSLLMAGVAAMNDGRNDEAIDCFGKLVRIRPIGSVYASLAECCWRADRFEEALRAVDEALAIDANDQGALLVRAAALHGLHRYEDALAAAIEAERRDPSSHVARARIGASLERLGRFEEAEQWFGRAAGPGAETKPYAAVGFSKALYERLLAAPDADATQAQTVFDSAAPGRHRHVVFACCDIAYFRKYGFNFLNSFAKNAAAQCLLHLHVMDPDERFAEIIGMTAEAVGLEHMVASISASPPEARAGVSLNVYYSCCRFLLLPGLLEKHAKPVICADIDAVFEGPVAGMGEFAARHDLALTPRSSAHAPWLDIPAGVVVANPNAASKRYFQLVRKYILDVAARGMMPWHLDQVAMYCVNRMMQRFGKAPDIGWLPRAVCDSLWQIGHNYDRLLNDPRFTRYSVGS